MLDSSSDGPGQTVDIEVKETTRKRIREEEEESKHENKARKKKEGNNFQQAVLEENQVTFTYDYPFTALLVGPTMSGKTYLAKKLIDHEFEKNFDFIYILSKTLRFNPQWDKYARNPKFKFYPKPSNDLLTEILEKQQSCQERARIENAQRTASGNSQGVVSVCPSVLLVLDDILDSDAVNFAGVCDTIAGDGRQCQLSLLILTQRMSKISRTIRLQARYIFVFKVISSEILRFAKEYMAYKSTREIERTMRRVFQRQYAFLLAVNSGSMAYLMSLGHSEANEFVQKKFVTVLF